MNLESKVELFKDRARKLGLKVTPQRVAVYRALLLRKDHPSAEELYEELKGKLEGISLTTVYRSLANLEKVGLVQKIPTPNGKVRYDARVEPHSHFICLECGRIYDIEFAPRIERELEVGKPIACSLVCYGVCKECQR